MKRSYKDIFPASPQSKINACKSGVYFEIDTKIDIDINKEPKLHDFGGDVSKRWFVDFYHDGARKRKWIAARPVKNKPERAKKELQKIKSLYKGTAYSLTTLNTFLDSLDLSAKTKSAFRTDLKILSLVFPDLKCIDPESFKDFLFDNYAHNTVFNKIKNIKSLFGKSFEAGIIESNPFAKFKNVGKDEDTDANFPFSEYERSILEPELKKNPPLWLFTRIIYYTFSRINETRLLKVGDINLKARTITFRKENRKGNKKTVRTVSKPILDPLLDLLISSGVLNYPSNYYLFSGATLKPGLSATAKNHPTTLHREVLQNVGIYRQNETGLYGWKPTGNIEAYLAGMDLKMIQLINDHRSIETTEIYLRKLGLFLNKKAFEIIF